MSSSPRRSRFWLACACLLAAALTGVACDDPPLMGPGDGGGTNTFSATLDGTSTQFTTGLRATNLNGLLTISGSDTRYSFTLSVVVSRGASTYQAGTSDPQNVVTANLALNGSATRW